VICKGLTRYIDAFLDDELSVIETLRVQAHLVFCEKCREAVRSEASLRSLIEADALQDRAPAGLKEILQQIGEMPQPEHPRSLRIFGLRPRAFFASLLAGAVTMGLIVSLASDLFRGPAGNISPLVAEIVAKHQLYSRSGGSLQVRSSDPMEVGSWLQERLGFAVRLPLRARPGENLVGARLSTIADGRIISLYIFNTLPALLSSESSKFVAGVPFFTSTLGGYRAVWWEDQKLYYAAISDSGIDDLIEFGLLCVNGRAL